MGQLADYAADMLTAYGVQTTPAWFRLYHGDSIELGFGITAPVTDNDWPERFDYYCRTNGKPCPKYIKSSVSGRFLGVPSGGSSGTYGTASDGTKSGIQDLIDNQGTTLAAHSGFTKIEVVSDLSVNDQITDGVTATQCLNRAIAYHAQALISGANTVSLTTTTASTGTSQETLRLAYNALLRAQYTNYIDMGVCAHVGDYSFTSDSTWFSQPDGLHPTAAGDDEMAAKDFGTQFTPTLTSGTFDETASFYTEVWTEKVNRSAVPHSSRTFTGATGVSAEGAYVSGDGTTTLVFALTPSGTVLSTDVPTVDVDADAVESAVGAVPNAAITAFDVDNLSTLTGITFGTLRATRVERCFRVRRV